MPVARADHASVNGFLGAPVASCTAAIGGAVRERRKGYSALLKAPGAIGSNGALPRRWRRASRDGAAHVSESRAGHVTEAADECRDRGATPRGGMPAECSLFCK